MGTIDRDENDSEHLEMFDDALSPAFTDETT